MREEFGYILFADGRVEKGNCFECGATDVPVISLVEREFGYWDPTAESWQTCERCVSDQARSLAKSIEAKLRELFKPITSRPCGQPPT